MGGMQGGVPPHKKIMNVQETSTKAYREEVKPTLGDRQKCVVDAFVSNDYRSMTNKEIADFLQWEINCVTPRIFELRKLGVVEEIEKRKCRATGRTAIAWGLVLQPVQISLL